jgi:hypothetical protein
LFSYTFLYSCDAGKLLLSAILRGSESGRGSVRSSTESNRRRTGIIYFICAGSSVPYMEVREFAEKLQGKRGDSAHRYCQKKMEEKGLIEAPPPPVVMIADELLVKEHWMAADIEKFGSTAGASGGRKN